MHFDFEDRLFDIPTIEPAMSWRERVLLSLFAHVIFGLLLVFGAQLPFVRDAAERRAERLAELQPADPVRAAGQAGRPATVATVVSQPAGEPRNRTRRIVSGSSCHKLVREHSQCCHAALSDDHG